MIRTLCFAIALLSPIPALALSCLAPSVERSYAQANAAAEHYVVVHGRLTFDMNSLPKGHSNDAQTPEMTLIKGILIGKSLSKSGFKLPFDQEVTLEVACFGPWCGSAQNGEDILAFVRKDETGYALGINPCGGYVFGAPNLKMLKAVKNCRNTGTCSTR